MFCEHVYNYMNTDICPKCGKDTHETDFKLINELHKKHIADGHADKYKCPDCGGTIRGWWDI